MDGDAQRERTPFGDFLRTVGDDLVADRGPRAPSMPHVGAEWRRLDKETPAIPGESLRGLVSKGCQLNTLPNSWGVLQHLGLTHRNRVLVSEDPAVGAAELAYALGVDEHEVVSRRYEPTAPGRLSFFGLELNAGRIENRVRRFSPTAFQDPKQRFHRAVWELKDLPFCLVGWDMLQDRCFCEGRGVVQGWTRTLTRIEECDECGDPLHELEPFPVPPAMRPALSVLAAIVDPRSEERASNAWRLPPALREADRTILYRTVIQLARALDMDADDAPIEDPAQRLRGLHLACEAISGWPTGWDRLQWHGAAAESAIPELRRLWCKLAPRAHVPSAGKHQRRRLLPAEAPKRPEIASTLATVVGIRPACEIARLSPKVMMAAWENGLVTRHHRTHGPQTLPGFDVAEVEAFASAWNDRVEPDALSHRLGIPYYGLEQLVGIRTLDADGLVLPETGPHCRSETVREFLRRFRENACRQLANPVPLKRIMESIGGRPKPWGPVLDRLHRGGLKFELRDGVCLIDSISIDEGDAGRVRTLAFDRHQHPDFRFRARMVKRDALELLNVGAGGGRLLVGLEWQGNNPQTYAVADVEDRAAKIMSVPELAARLGIDSPSAFHRARRSGVREIIPGGWDRARLLNLS